LLFVLLTAANEQKTMIHNDPQNNQELPTQRVRADENGDGDGFLKFLQTNPASFVENLDDVIAAHWLLVADGSGADFQPRFLEALHSKGGIYVDLKNGGLSPLGQKKFGANSLIFSAAERHRQLRQQQNRPPIASVNNPADAPHHMPIDKLSVHPINSQIFEKDNDEDDALIRDIEGHGQLEPIVVNSSYVVISGHRRLRALLTLGRTMALVIISQVAPENEEEHLLAYNLHRHMSNVEKIRVFSRYRDIERKRAATRQHSGKELTETFPDGCKGEARDIAAKFVRLSGRSAEMGLRVYQESEKRRKSAPQEVKTVTEALNISILAGHKTAVCCGWFDELPVKKKSAGSPAQSDMAGAISSASAALNENPGALRLFRKSLPTVRKALGPKVNPDKLLALRRYAQALIALADELETKLA
jgi:hypothetical protein